MIPERLRRCPSRVPVGCVVHYSGTPRNSIIANLSQRPCPSRWDHRTAGERRTVRGPAFSDRYEGEFAAEGAAQRVVRTCYRAILTELVAFIDSVVGVRRLLVDGHLPPAGHPL